MSGSVYCKRLALVTGWLLLPARFLAQCSPSSTSFAYEVTPADNFAIYWTPDTSSGNIAFQAVYSGQGYTSVGFSEDGSMVGSDAVIALPDDSSVEVYFLAGKVFTAVTPFEVQDISSTSVSQDGSTTTMEFTRPFKPSDPNKMVLSTTPGDTTDLVWAYGSSNALDTHSSSGRGSVSVDLFCSGIVATETISPSPAPTVLTPVPVVTVVPTVAPVSTIVPTVPPTVAPVSTIVPTVPPTVAPVSTIVPTVPPTVAPVSTIVPTVPPTVAPVSTASPTGIETHSPSATIAPTSSPTSAGSMSSAPTLTTVSSMTLSPALTMTPTASPSGSSRSISTRAPLPVPTSSPIATPIDADQTSPPTGNSTLSTSAGLKYQPGIWLVLLNASVVAILAPSVLLAW